MREPVDLPDDVFACHEPAHRGDDGGRGEQQYRRENCQGDHRQQLCGQHPAPGRHQGVGGEHGAMLASRGGEQDGEYRNQGEQRDTGQAGDIAECHIVDEQGGATAEDTCEHGAAGQQGDARGGVDEFAQLDQP